MPAGWEAVLVGRTPLPLDATADAAGVAVDVPTDAAAGGTVVRVGAVQGEALPVVVSGALARALSLAAGDTTTLAVPGHRIDVTVADVLPVVPGSADPVALLADADAWSVAQLRTGATVAAPDEVWAWPAAGPSDGRIPAALRSTGTAARVEVGAPLPTPLLEPALAAFRLATWATVVLATAGVLAAARAAARERRSEVGALRGLGLPGRAQAALRVSEQVRVLVPAAAVGAAGGWGLTALVAQPLVDALDTGALPLAVPPTLDMGALAVWLGTTAVALAVVVALGARDTAWRARTASPLAEVPA